MSEISQIKPLRYWVQKVLPLVYDDSLSYYELLNKVVLKLNMLIENNDNLSDYIRETILELITPESIEEMLSEIFADLRHNIAVFDDGESSTATANVTKGEWVWLNDDLYEATRDMNVGDAYITTGTNPNVVKVSVEEKVQAVITYINNTKNNLKHNIAEADDYDSTTAEISRNKGSLLWLNDTLYVLLTNINAGDRYVVGTNIEQTTIEDELNKLKDELLIKYYPDDELMEVQANIVE